MQHGPKTSMTTHPSKFRQSKPHQSKPYQPGPASNQWASNNTRPEMKGPQNAQRNYERYLALAQAAALSGDTIGAENFYQHAEHYFRSMSPDRGAPLPR